MQPGSVYSEARSLGGLFARRRALNEQLRRTPLLVCLSGPCKGDESFIESVPFRVGRGKNNQFVLGDGNVSGSHAVISRNGVGRYTIVAAHQTMTPLYVRNWGRYRPVSHLSLQNGMIVRLGRQGPRLRFRYLGEHERRSGLLASIAGSRPEDELLPDEQVRTRLEQMFASGRLGEQERHYVHQAARYLASLATYRRWLASTCLALIVLLGMVIFHQMRSSQSNVELSLTRTQLLQKWTLSNQYASDDSSQEKSEDEKSDMLLASDRTAKGIYAVMRSFGIEKPYVSYPFVTLVKAEIEKEKERLLRDSDLEGFLDRYRRYHPRIEDIFIREYQLPSPLAYVAWIESDYFIDAESEDGALGMWQFLVPTADEYGLITEKGEDFRQDFERSTRAAARYLSDLHAQFGMENFMVALAAYDWGPSAVFELHKRHRLWQPSQRSFPFMLGLKTDRGEAALPEDTIRYVPRFFVANLIGSDMSFYLDR